jgi:hypothetical protein
MGKYDDIIAMGRRMYGSVSPSDAARASRVAGDPDFLRRLEAEQLQWKNQFGFEPERLYPSDVNVQVAGRRLDSGMPPEPDMTLGSPSFDALYKAAGQFDQLRTGRMANLRNQNPELVRIAASQINEADDAARAARAAKPNRAADAAAIAAAAGGVGLMVAPTSMAPGSRKASAEPMGEPADLVESGNPADLRDEPVSTASVPNKPDPAYEARQILQKLNAMRRAAGGEVPEAQAMMAEANRLLAMADETRNAPGYEPEMPTDYHGQATLLIQKLNQMRRQAGGEVPQAAQIMAEVRRLQAMGDNQRWSN